MKKILAAVLCAAMVAALAGCGSTSTSTTAASSAKSEAATTAASSAKSEATAEASTAEASTEDAATEEIAADAIVLQVGAITTATSSYVLACEHLDELLNEKTNGQIRLEIFSDGQLGGETELIEGVSLGTIDMCVTSSSPMANYVTDYYSFDLPYLVTDLDAAHDVFDGELGRAMLDELSDIGIYGLALWDNGFRDLTNNKLPVYTLDDLKGLKIRVMENELHQALWTALGAYPTPMSFAEVITSLEQGTIDGQENPLNAIYSSGVYEVQKYISLTNHVFTAGVIMMNQAKWDSLTAEQQEIFTECMAETTQWERDEVVRQDTEYKDLLIEAGLEINEVDNIQDWADAVSGIYDDYADKVNAELVEALRG